MDAGRTFRDNRPAISGKSSAGRNRRRLPGLLVDPREESGHLAALMRRHVLEVATAIDDLPEVLRLDPLELLPDRRETIDRLVAHVLRDPARAARLAGLQVVAG